MYFTQYKCRNIIRKRNIFHAQVAAILQIISRISLVKVCLWHVCYLAWNTPTAKHCGTLVATVKHTLAVHTRHIINIVAVTSLQKNAQVQTSPWESVRHTESKVGIRVANVRAIIGWNGTVLAQITIVQLARLAIYTICNIAIEAAKRSARRVENHIIVYMIRRNCGRIYLRQLQTLELIAIERNIKIGVPIKLTYKILRTNSKFPSMVFNLTSVECHRIGIGTTRRKRHIHQQIVRQFIIIIHIECEAIMQHCKVKADICLRCCLPCQLRITQTILRTCGHCIGISVSSKPLNAVDAVRSEVAIIAQTTLVTCLTPSSAQLQVINPSYIFHELFLRNTPRSRKRREITPSMSRCKFWTTVGT